MAGEGRAARLGEDDAAGGGIEATTAPAGPAPLILEFELPVAAAARLGRAPFVTAHRQGRSRGSTVETFWHDTAEGTLAAKGLMIEAGRRGPRRLIRTLPGSAAPWHPARPPELIRDLAADEAPEEAGGTPLVPLAAFAGRQQALQLAMPEGVVAAVLIAGRLRSVAAEREGARLRLSGPVAAVLAAARGLAQDLPLLPPRACLAEEARALATGTAPRPARLGPPDTSAAGTTEAAFTAAFGHLLEVLCQQSARIEPEAGPEPVHQSRVALRRLRSVFRVFRAAADGPTLRGLDAQFREVLAVLGPARDWDVFLGGIGRDIAAAFPGERRIQGLLKAARARRDAAYDAVLAMLAAPAWRLLLIDATGVLLRQPWRTEGTDGARALLDAPVREFARAILDRRWQRMRRAGADFEQLSAEALHELRLDAKRLRYAAEVFAPVLNAKAGRRFLRRIARLQDGLGIANDAAVARGLAQALAGGGPDRSWAIGVVEGWSEARVADHRNDAFAAWDRLGGKDRFWTDN